VLALRHADVALTIDNSDSMKGAKLAQAIAAAQTFVSMLDMPGDQAALITYDEYAHLAHTLTGDRASLSDAVAGIASGSGTRIDRGIETAVAALAADGRRSDNRPVIVLLSDGIQVEERARPLELAIAARKRGIDLYTIALGTDADRAMLRDLAGDPAHTFYAPQASDLEVIYRRIAGDVVCR
jgi:Mg-chelatase subunit ChlD